MLNRWFQSRIRTEVVRLAHNQQVIGSIPISATKKPCWASRIRPSIDSVKGTWGTAPIFGCVTVQDRVTRSAVAQSSSPQKRSQPTETDVRIP